MNSTTMLPFLLSLSLLGCRSSDDTDTKTDPVDTGTTAPVDGDGDGFTSDDGDCNDDDAGISPAATEICDGIDNDCDGAVDQGVTTTFYADADGDGYGDEGVTEEACEVPAGFSATGGDCDDLNSDTFTGAAERCDDKDNDCDGEVDEEVQSTWFADSDSDGFGDGDTTLDSCDPDAGYVANSDDCNDSAVGVNPAAVELCDGVDNNCDDVTDEDAVDMETWYADADSDGFVDPETMMDACETPVGFAAGTMGEVDCDDTNTAINPAATEMCDDVDNNCDGETDEDSAEDAATWYADLDGDGHGGSATTTEACAAPAGYLATADDCDDFDDTSYPDGVEVCDDADNNCDGEVDEGVGTTWFADSDSDGYGDIDVTVDACDTPTGYVADNTDCDDSNIDINTAATEICDAENTDENCNGTADDADTDATGKQTFFTDSDEDTYGDDTATGMEYCDAPTGMVLDNTDCDDTDSEVYPDAPEICTIIDANCDGIADEETTTYGNCEGMPGSSCDDILSTRTDTLSDGIYYLAIEGGEPFGAYCDMTTDSGGWTLLMKTSGDTSYDYDDVIWENSETDNASSINTDTSENAKLQTYLELPISEMRGCFPSEEHCIYVEYGTSRTALAIFTGGAQQQGSAFDEQMPDSGWSYQPHCKWYGVNSPYCYRRTRFGFTSNQENNCSSNDTAIGFGLAPYCHSGGGERHGSGAMCLSSNCTEGSQNEGFPGLIWGR